MMMMTVIDWYRRCCCCCCQPTPAAVEEKKKAFMKRKDAQKKMWAEEREAKGLPPIIEPDGKVRDEKLEKMIWEENLHDEERLENLHDEERFPGDAGTMREAENKRKAAEVREKNSAEVFHMYSSTGRKRYSTVVQEGRG